MPVKFKPSEKIRNKKTGIISTVHYYLKNMTTKDIEKVYEDERTKPKLKVKLKREIERRNK